MLSESSSVNLKNVLPPLFERWFKSRGWHARDHQLDVLDHARNGETCLLIAPTGGGKTLAGFLPSLIDLAENKYDGVHTLYISPLKALAVDIARNLETPVKEMGLAVTVETRTGDTPQSKRARQRYNRLTYLLQHLSRPRCLLPMREPTSSLPVLNSSYWMSCMHWLPPSADCCCLWR